MLGHPNFIANSLYIAGDSYSGKIVPIIVQKMSDGNEKYILSYLKVYTASLFLPKKTVNFAAAGIEAGDSPLLNLKVRDKIRFLN